MGQVLSEPVVTKHSASGSDDRLAFGVSEMQGWRLTMEDAHTHLLDLDSEAESSTASKQRRSFFAVFDGHGGSTVAKFAGDTVYSRLRATDEYRSKSYEDALKRTFLGTDEDLRSHADFQGDPSGCTAVAVLIDENNKIFCANAGDSRSVMSIDGEVEPLSHDHKPVNKSENARIVAAGGFVEFGRVNGNLALSRALGDFEFKQNASLGPEQQVVTANPDIIVHEPTNADEFVVIACDGIWDVMSSQHVVDYVRRSIGQRKPLEKICEDIMDRCLAPDSDCSGVGCDNMTIMVVALLKDRSLDQWYDHIANKLDNKVGYETPQLDDLPQPFRERPAHMGFGGFSGGEGDRAGRLGGGGLASVIRGNSILYNTGHGGDDESSAHSLEDEEEDEQSLLSNLQAALRREGIRIASLQPDDDEVEDERFESMDVDETDSASESGHSANSVEQKNDEIPHPAVQTEGLADKSEDPVKAATAAA